MANRKAETLTDYLNVHRNAEERLNLSAPLGASIVHAAGVEMSIHFTEQLRAYTEQEVLIESALAYLADSERKTVALQIDEVIAGGQFDGVSYMAKGSNGEFIWVLQHPQVTNATELDADDAAEAFRTMYDFHLPIGQDLEEFMYLPVSAIRTIAA